MNELIKANLLLLDQAAALLALLPADVYVRTSAIFSNASIGGHMRHCLEHYHCLLRDLAAGAVDYDRRARDTATETDAAVALARLHEICKALASLHSQPGDLALRVRMDHGGAEACSDWQASTLGRELQFLISHTVHHHALIAGLCNQHGQVLVAGFGFAPSTLRYQQQFKAA